MTVLDRSGAAGPATTRRPPDSAASSDALLRRLAAGVLAGSLGLVTLWWVGDGAGTDLLTWATGLTSLGRWTGLVASVLLLAQVVLMARVPRLEQAYGQDQLARVHRVVGFSSFTLMVLHIVLVTWGYAAGSLLASPTTLWDLVIHYPGMLLAAAGTVCLFLVVGTSIKAARRKLRYESWHLLHLYAYLGVGLALPHQLWTGKDLSATTVRTVFWWTAWAAAAGAVLVWRIGLPVWRNLRHQLRVVSVVPEAPGVLSIVMTGRRLDRLRVDAGQFLNWRFLGRPGWTRANPFSLSAAPDGQTLRITVQAVGDGSSSLARLRPGTRVLVEGPHGRLSARARRTDGVLLIGSGVGMAPIRGLAESLAYAPGRAALVHRYSEHELFADEIAAVAARRGLQIARVPGPRRHQDSWLSDSVGRSLSDLDVLRWWVPDLTHRDVYVCGPAGWTALVTADLRRAGVPDDQVHVETFGW